MPPDRDIDADPWGPAVDVPEFGPVPDPEADPVLPDNPRELPDRMTRARRRLARAPLPPLPLAATLMLVIVGVAGGWRLVLLAALVAAAVAATRLRFSDRAALGLLTLVALLAIAGWAPGSDRRPPAARGHHAPTHTRRAKT